MRHNGRRVVTIVSTDPDLVAAGVFEFCAAAYPGLPLTAGMRELILRGIGTDPLEATIAAARRAAFVAAVNGLRTVIADSFQSASDSFRAEAMIARANYEAAVNEGVAVALRQRGIEP